MKEKKSVKTQDLGSGSIPKLFLQLVIPAIVAQIVNLLYNLVDRISIGHIPEVGASALTGVGLFTAILMLINAFAMLAGAGGAPLASIAPGKQNKDKAEKIMALGQAKISLFLAEPVSDIIAATVTTIAFFTQFKKILSKTAK